ncbi:MAG TPA: hypothetical protein VIS31_07570 [Woeseiaceae bacterium]
MSENVTKVPMSFWIVAGVATAWNLIGLMIYYQQMTVAPEVLARNFTPEQVAFITQTPAWATSAYAIAVNAGLLGSILLLLRKAWAIPLYAISLVAVLIQDLHGFVLADGLAVWGSGALVLPAIVLVIAVFLLVYSRNARAGGLIS